MDIRLRNIILCLVKKHFPASNGRKRVEPEFVLDELLRMLWTGCPWRSVQTTHSSYQTIHRHFMLWSQQKIFREAYSIAYRGRNATKLSAVVDQDGLPLSLVFFPANVHDVHTVEPTLKNRIVATAPSQALYADKKITLIHFFFNVILKSNERSSCCREMVVSCIRNKWV